ncbi:MAG: glutamate--tRNA ligase [Candidatus Portnoybacteria bacterium RBG_19FT_COMBO_36_7]|uniref:Glutamate--tRNA ligase n=1 Tax=Candidatus Portnoybacteria bacterium RBG_19FT_COMBO_36_7 TaxID=1801992 RepID=A0A1G2F987_9BACT|nr:MAG: glutamate--tRNA ligase [Candidatus Portnoybacteria bacterium RBG_19FT_COMBO_36_7]
MLNIKLRTRFAPSPTGYLHIGGLRTALYSYLFAKQNNGQFILRLEDTDLKRQVEGAAERIYEGLKWAGLNYDEGPDVGGDFGPYIQSKRLKLYKNHADELIQKDRAYYCFCTDETLEKMREEQIAKKQAPKYDRRCLNLPADEIESRLKNNEPHVIRMKIPANRIIEFNDIVRGKVAYNTNELDDQVLLKSDGYPTYHLAVVVDDHLMQISHVTRTEEWLPSTPKHILLYEYFGWERPHWAHLPLLLNPDKSKMSKRKGDVAVEDYIKKGYLAEAMINFLAFLGWNPGTEKEIYSIEELLKDFSLEKVHKAGAIFNIEKLNWYNQYHMRQMDLDKLTEACIPYLTEKGLIFPKFDHSFEIAAIKGPFTVKEFEINQTKEKISFDFIKKAVALERERASNLSQIGESVRLFFEEPEYDKDLLFWKDASKEEIKNSLKILEKIINEIPEKSFTKEKLQEIIMPEAQKLPNRGIMLWPLRAALSGQKASPGPFEIAEALGKEKTLERIKKAIEKL